MSYWAFVAVLVVRTPYLSDLLLRVRVVPRVFLDTTATSLVWIPKKTTRLSRLTFSIARSSLQ
jgi:hypothetical protein